MTAATTETKETLNKKKANGQEKGQGNNKQRVLSNPNDVAGLVMMQIDQVNTKKDELTIAVKGLADTTKQLVRAYAQQQQVIGKLAERVKKLEDKPESK